MAVLTVVIAIVAVLSTWHLIVLVGQLLLAGGLDPANHEVLQTIFGTIFTVLIALEFRHLLLGSTSEKGSVVRVRSVVLIAMLALGVIYWLVRTQDQKLGVQGFDDGVQDHPHDFTVEGANGMRSRDNRQSL